MVCSHCPTPIQTPTKWVFNPIASVSVSVLVSLSVGQCEHLHTILYNPFFIGVGVCVSVGPCEHTIITNTFFLKILEGMSPFCGATDTLDLWWRLLWVSKPEWAGTCVTCSLRFTSGVTPADLLAASMVAKPFLPCTCKALVGLETGSYHAAAHSVRSGRRSTDWAIPANNK